MTDLQQHFRVNYNVELTQPELREICQHCQRDAYTVIRVQEAHIAGLKAQLESEYKRGLTTAFEILDKRWNLLEQAYHELERRGLGNGRIGSAMDEIDAACVDIKKIIGNEPSPNRL